MENKKYMSIPELARFLGLTRIAVYKKVKKGQIKATKIGKSYAIPIKYVAGIIGTELGDSEKNKIDEAVKKTVKEYGEVLKKLGRE